MFMYVIIYDYSDILAWSWITLLCIFSLWYETNCLLCNRLLACDMKQIVYYVIGGPYVSDQAGLN